MRDGLDDLDFAYRFKQEVSRKQEHEAKEESKPEAAP
jgi:hypothetical protein